MTISTLEGIQVMGLASAVPETVETLEGLGFEFGEKEAQKLFENTGVCNRHVVPDGMCTSDLCFASAEKLLSELGWDRASVGTLVFVSQTPDYLLPATSCVLHRRLNLKKHCAAFDINLGCSGYLYGLWIASQMAMNSDSGRALLLVGDTVSRILSQQDRSTAPLFGDAGTATALERTGPGHRMVFQLGTDGRGSDHLVVPAGGFRRPRSEETSIRTKRESNNVRSDEDLYMNGGEIFMFSLREVPPLIASVTAAAGWTADTVDAFVMHQANRFMLQHLTKKMKLPPEKVIIALENYGNTSSASIPLALTTSLRTDLEAGPRNLVLAGFGVGFSWGAVALTCGPLVMPELVVAGAGDSRKEGLPQK